MARLFLSTDDNAPVISGADSTCVVNLLKKCLIEGYGNKAPTSGWTMPFVNAEGTAACFRNDHEHGGTGFYLAIDQTGTQCRVSAYEDMSGATEGTFPFCPKAYTLNISNVATTARRAWLVLASPLWVFLCIYREAETIPSTYTSSGNSEWRTHGFWFGDIDRWLPDDHYNCMLVFVTTDQNHYGFGSSSNLSSTPTISNNSSGYGYMFPRNSDGAGGNPQGHYCYLPHPQIASRFGYNGPAYSAGAGLLVGRAALSDGAAYSLRGWIPEMLVPLHAFPSFGNLERVEIDGVDWLSVIVSCGRTAYSEMAQALFKLDPGE